MGRCWLTVGSSSVGYDDQSIAEYDDWALVNQAEVDWAHDVHLAG